MFTFRYLVFSLVLQQKYIAFCLLQCIRDRFGVHSIYTALHFVHSSMPITKAHSLELYADGYSPLTHFSRDTDLSVFLYSCKQAEAKTRAHISGP